MIMTQTMTNPPLVEKVCAHCGASHGIKESELCGPCCELPRCEICEVIFGGLVSASQENPNRCDSDLDYEKFIDLTCVKCDKAIPIYVSKKSPVPNYVLRGNWCPTCNSEAKKSSMEAKEHNQDQFIGYLAIMKKLYDGGHISQTSWEDAVRANPHDVLHWLGIEDLIEEEDDADLLAIDEALEEELEEVV